MEYISVVTIASNYETDDLHDALTKYSKLGYRLVSTEMTLNKYYTHVMYLFFDKEVE